jgi:hypothetical protein
MSVRDRRQTPRSRLVCGSRSSRPSWGRHLRPNASLSLPVSDGKVRSYAHSFQTEYPVERQKKGRLDPFAAPFGYDRYLRIGVGGIDDNGNRGQSAPRPYRASFKCFALASKLVWLRYRIRCLPVRTSSSSPLQRATSPQIPRSVLSSAIL